MRHKSEVVVDIETNCKLFSTVFLAQVKFPEYETFVSQKNIERFHCSPYRYQFDG